LPDGDFSRQALAILAGLTMVAFVVMGYHPGLEDDSFYLAAIKWRLNPALFPSDSDFFRLQFQATIFDKLIAMKQSGYTLVVVEQNAAKALAVADRGYVLELGRNRFEGTGAALLTDPEVKRLYLGG